MIEKLTSQQEKRLIETREYWLKTGLSTERADRIKTENTIIQMYGLIGKQKPRFIWMDSPFGCLISIALAKKCMKTGSNLGSNLRSNLRSNLWSNLESNLGSNLWSNLESNLWSNLWSNLGSNLWSNLGSNLESNLGEIFDGTYFYGSLDSYWISFYKFCNEIGVPYSDLDSKNLNLWSDLAHSCFWWWGYENVCFVSDRPKAIHKNKEGRLHNEKGLALEFHDGYGLFALNGINVPAWVVTTEAGKIDPQLALTEKNVDVQREIIRKVGAERMLKACKAKTLDVFIDSHSKGGNEYKLLEMKIGGIERKYLYFEHASFPGVFYAHPIHPDLKRALHARAWMLGIGEHDELPTKSDEEIKECLPLEVA